LGSKSAVILGEKYGPVIYSKKIEKNPKNRKNFYRYVILFID
jgi:hypothetical protein